AAPQLPRTFRPLVRLGTRDVAHEVAPDQTRRRLGAPDETLRIEIDARDDRLLGPAVAEVPHERAGIDALDAGNAVPREVGAEALLRAPARGSLAVLAHDEAAHVGTARLDVLTVHADVADLRVGHGDELPLVGGIGQDLLVPGHAGVEDELARDLTERAEGAAAEDRAVGKREERGLRRHQALRSAAACGRSSCRRRPPTSTACTRPIISHPSKGVLRPLERKWRASTCQQRSGSTSVRSAAAPGARVPAGSPRMRAGPQVIRAIRVGRSATPSRANRSTSGKAVSRPTTPFAAWSNSTSFSSW